jgi:hypothetical protein
LRASVDPTEARKHAGLGPSDRVVRRGGIAHGCRVKCDPGIAPSSRTTAVSQSGRLDALLVLMAQSRMI